MSQSTISLESVIAALSDLIGNCYIAREGYLQATKAAVSPSYRVFFAACGYQRNAFTEELLALANAVDGKRFNPLAFINALQANLEATPTPRHVKNDAEILFKQRQGEDESKRTYEHALDLGLPYDVHEVVNRQYDALMIVHGQIYIMNQEHVA